MKTGEDGKFLSSQEDRIRWSMFLAAAIKAGSSLRAGVQEADEAMGAYWERCTATAKPPVITDPLKQKASIAISQAQSRHHEASRIFHVIEGICAPALHPPPLAPSALREGTEHHDAAEPEGADEAEGYRRWEQEAEVKDERDREVFGEKDR